MKELNRLTVLNAVMSNATPIGSIVDRLVRRPYDRDHISTAKIKQILELLIADELVIARKSDDGMLYQKVPHAAAKLRNLTVSR